MKSKIRYSFPGKIYEMLLTDNKFYQDITKLKYKIEEPFPKYDQYKSADGLHMNFALAGYSSGDISILVRGRQLVLSANGLEAIEEIKEQPSESIPEINLDSEEEYSKPAKSNVHKGHISRGIARRPFKTQFYISEEFDLSKVEADMKNGLLHIFIPEVQIEDIEIKIK